MSESGMDGSAIVFGFAIAATAWVVGGIVYDIGGFDRCKDVLRELRIANQPAAVTVLLANSCVRVK